MGQPSSAEIQAAIEIGKIAADLLGGLFKDKDYPFAQVVFSVVQGRYKPIAVKVLDGGSISEWRALNQQLQRDINAELKRTGQFGKTGVLATRMCIGYASGRPGSKLGNGFFASNRGCSFNEGASRTNIPTIEAAIRELYRLLNESLLKNKRNKPLFTGKTGTVNTPTTVNNDVNDGLNDTLDSIDNSLLDLGVAITSGIGSLVDQNESFADDLLGGLGDIFSDTLGGATADFDDFLDKLYRVLRRYNRDAATVHGDAQRRIADSAEQAIDNTVTLHNEYQDVLIDNTNQFFDTADLVLMEFADTNRGLVDNVLDAIEDFFKVGERDLVDLLDDFLGGLLDDLGVLFPEDKDIVEAILENAGIISEELQRDTATVIDEWPDVIKRSVEVLTLPEELRDLDPDEGERDILGMIADALQIDGDACRIYFSNTLPKNSMAESVGSFLIGLATVALLPLLIAQARAQACMYGWNRENPTRILEPADVVEAEHRGIISHDQAVEFLRMHGFDETNADIITDIVKTIPDETLLLSMWLRGIISPNSFDAAMEGRGYETFYIDAIKEAAFFIPPVQDLITMAVREVFTPEVAEKFGQFEDFPTDFAEWAAKQGVSQEWAERYWAAHWALPSVQMGYEMLHRSVITEDELNLLLKSQDVMPFWRDKLIEISYAPYTRVDIRRMHKVGVLNEAEVKRAYMDIGYNEERAEKLTEFTMRLNEDDNILDVGNIDELTRSNILRFYEDGVINRETAYSMLLQVGFDINTAALWLIDVDLREEQRERKEQAALIVAQAKAGVISFEQANDQLVSMNLTSKEVIKYQRALTTAQAERNKTPPKGDLDKMYQANIIGENIYRVNMAKLGYSDTWTTRYLELMGVSDDES